MRISHLNGWRAAEAVIRCGTVAGAAEELGVTTAAVGAQLRGLEDALGRSLFERGPGGLAPLPETRDVAQVLTRALSDIAGIHARLQSGGEASHRLSLAVTQTFAETWLPRHLETLFAQVAAVDLRLDTRWDVVDLAAGQHDFAIRYMALGTDAFDAVPLLPSGVVPVCTPEFAARYGLDGPAPSLSRVPVVTLDVPTSDPDWADWDGWSRRIGIPLEREVQVAALTLSGSGIRIAQSGIGLVLGGLSECFHAIEAGRLVMPFGAGSVAWGRYWHQLIWRKERRLGPVQRAFRDWATDRARADRAVMARLFGAPPDAGAAGFV